MLDINYIRDNVDEIKKNCQNRGVKVDIDKLLEVDKKRRSLLKKVEDLKAEKNKNSKSKPDDQEIKRMKEFGQQIKKMEKDLKNVMVKYYDLLLQIPNLTHPESPVGAEDKFRVIEEVGKELSFKFEPKDHEKLMISLDQLDFLRGAKVAGNKFYYTKGNLVKLNHTLLGYGMDIVTKHGYELMETPDLVKAEIVDGSGFNPRGEESQIYKIEDHDLNLIGTAEIPLLGYHANEVIDLSKGPIKYAGISMCYRTEGGAYGKTNKGMYRVHQFSKLEMFVFCKPEDSEVLHNELREIEKEICDGLGLSYRIIDTPTGDLGGPAYRKFDFEARMVVKDFGEITSASNCTDYQARRLNIKFVNKSGKKEYVHTLNGTAMVSSRFPLAIYEQFQNLDGSINIPTVLKKYM
jgi:seryl-tRNA synthetase